MTTVHHYDDDRTWFEQHPRRTARLRPTYPGDLEAHDGLAPGGTKGKTAPGLAYTCIKQVRKGTRLYALLTLRHPPAANEATARKYFERAVEMIPELANMYGALKSWGVAIRVGTDELSEDK